jgi:hypothetical protein
MNIFLDDIREVEWIYSSEVIDHLKLPWVTVRSYEEFVQWIREHGLPKFISFDHDLGTEMTGYDCALWLVEYCLDNKVPLPNYNVHSANPVGRDNIFSLFSNFKKQVP